MHKCNSTLNTLSSIANSDREFTFSYAIYCNIVFLPHNIVIYSNQLCRFFFVFTFLSFNFLSIFCTVDVCTFSVCVIKNDKLKFHLSHFFPSLKFTIFLSLLSHTVLSTLLILVVCRTRVTTNSVKMTSLATSLPVAQWLERPSGVREVMGSNSRRGLRFFLCPTLVTN